MSLRPCVITTEHRACFQDVSQTLHSVSPLSLLYLKHHCLSLALCSIFPDNLPISTLTLVQLIFRAAKATFKATAQFTLQSCLMAPNLTAGLGIKPEARIMPAAAAQSFSPPLPLQVHPMGSQPCPPPPFCIC